MKRWLVLTLLACDTDTVDLGAIEAACEHTGGQLTTAECCAGTRDYPNVCDSDPCDPSRCGGDTEVVLYCLCGPRACWDGSGCSLESN